MKFFNNLINKSKGHVYIIAEACDNHMGSLDMAKALAVSAKKSGADAVKFQHHLVDEEMVRTDIMSDNFEETLDKFLDRNALSINDHVILKEYCDKIGITYLCTPFSYKAAEEINNLVPFFKIGSGEFQDYWFIDNLIKLKKPVIFSSGMCTIDEIKRWIKRYKKSFPDIALMNTISEYPPLFEDMNLNFIQKLINIVKCTVGHSDHTQTIFTSVIAVANGAKIIEKHLTISHDVSGPDKDVSLDGNEFKDLVTTLRKVSKTLGNNKTIQDNEIQIRKWAYRSVVFSKKLSSGHVISHNDIKTKRPGTGEILSVDYQKVIGKKLKVDVDANQFVLWNNFV